MRSATRRSSVLAGGRCRSDGGALRGPPGFCGEVNGVLVCIEPGAPSLAWFHHLSQQPVPTTTPNNLSQQPVPTASHNNLSHLQERDIVKATNKRYALTKVAAVAMHKSFKWVFDITQVR